MQKTDALTSQSLRAAFGEFATGVTVVTTRGIDGDHGMTLNAFMSISLDPPLVSISLARSSRMLALLRRSRTYAVNVLRDDMEALALHFAGRANPQFTNSLSHENGYPVIPGAAARFLARLEAEVEAGDHVIMIGRVIDIHHDKGARPLLFCQGKFRQIAFDRVD